ncbi:Metal-dependent hydrolase [Planctomycetales bacterium 10988]|nr:Metal-dependent hydrolase [Planctomycetales bacterium 10988]
MRKSLSYLLIIVLLSIGGYFFRSDLETLLPQPHQNNHSDSSKFEPSGDSLKDSITIASFNIQVFGQSKLEDSAAMDILARTARRFDIIAVQEIRSKSQDVMPRFIDLINRGGHRYDYVIGPRIGRTVSKEQYAYVYNTDRLELDPSSIHTVYDPEDMLHREPLVGTFRVRGVSPDSAFTFTLINIHTDPDEVDLELNVLDDVFRAVIQDGRGEDDVIMLGDFNTEPQESGEFGSLPNIHWAIQGVPSNTRGTKLYDNLVFSTLTTTEFTGRAGVFDLCKAYNLTLEQALEVSDHFPVWAEFTVEEGGKRGRIAQAPGGSNYR